MKQKSNSKPTVAVLFGGRSSEHEISILTALQAMSAIDSLAYDIMPVYWHPDGKFYVGKKLFEKSFYRQFASNQVQEVTLLPDPQSKGFVEVVTGALLPVDVYFLCFHGQYGEDGCIQGLLELKRAVYTGCSLTSAAVAMNKYLCKLIVQAHGIPALPHCMVRKADAWRSFQAVQERIVSTPGLSRFPLFIKPCHLGSSVGISIANDPSQLQTGLARGFYYDDEVLVEPALTNFMEINVAVLDGEPPIASVVEIPKATGAALSYEDKYLRGGKKGSSQEGMAALSRVINPDIDPVIKNTICNYALKAFVALGSSGVGRFDFMVNLDDGAIYFNELNPIPGSLSFYLWEKSEPSMLYTEVINQMITCARNKRKMQLSLQQTLEFKALTAR